MFAGCGGDDDGLGSESGSADATSAPDADAPAGADPWDLDLCTLLADDEVAALFDGSAPTESAYTPGGAVETEDYGGSSCRWKVSVSQYLNLDVYPTVEGRLDEIAAYDPNDRWAVEPLSGIGDDARLILWDGPPELDTPGSVGGLVTEQGAVQMRLMFTADFPDDPDELIAAAQLIFDRL